MHFPRGSAGNFFFALLFHTVVNVFVVLLSYSVVVLRCVRFARVFSTIGVLRWHNVMRFRKVRSWSTF